MPVPAPVTIAILAVRRSHPRGPPLLSVIGCERDFVGLPSMPTYPRPHAGRVERHHHVAVRVEAYHAPSPPTGFNSPWDDRVGRLLDRYVGVLDTRADGRARRC